MTVTQVNTALANKILPFLNLSCAVANDATLIEGILGLCSGNRQEPIIVQSGSPLAQFLDAFIPTLPTSGRGTRAVNRNPRPCPPCSRKHQGCVIISAPGQPRLCMKCKERGLSLCPVKARDGAGVHGAPGIPVSGQGTSNATAPSVVQSRFSFALDDPSFSLSSF